LIAYGRRVSARATSRGQNEWYVDVPVRRRHEAELDIVFVGDFDKESGPLGAKGLGELTAVSVAPAIANAIFHVTGKRIRGLPIAREKLFWGGRADALDGNAVSPAPQTLSRNLHRRERSGTMNAVIHILAKSGLLTKDLDYHLIRASMVLIFLAFGYQKWFAYEAQVLIPYISNGPLIFWLYPVFGIRGASWFLGVSEWLFGALLFLGFWNKRLGILGAIGSTATFVGTVTIIPFMPNGWDPVAGFPAMAGNVPFLMKDVVLLAVSIYLLKQDVERVLEAGARTDVALSQA
jgi:uncharacterized membrane protein YkgB